MDRIVVRTNADMGRVLDWAEELHGLAVELPFPEGEIEFQEEGLLLKFRDEEHGIVWFECDTHGKKIAEWRSDMSTGDIPELHVSGEGEKKMGLCMVLASDNTVAKCVRKFRAIMLFAAYYREEVQSTRVVSRTGGTKKRSSGKRSIRRPLTVRRYTIGAEMLSELPAPKRVWKGYSESFGVRGHYRHYSSGRTVWVRPYQKKGRSDKLGDREYLL